jgi:hypothetical protein
VHLCVEATSGILSVSFNGNHQRDGEYGGGEVVSSFRDKKESKQGSYLLLSCQRLSTRCGFCRQKGERYE